MKRLLLVLFLAFGLIATIALFNAFNFRPKPVDSLPMARIKVDPAPAAERLAGALRFPTISFDNPQDMDDGAAFLGLHGYLEQQFPRTHHALNRETVSQYSLLYTWPGSDAALAPVVLLAHLDVVPPEPASLSAWTHPPFAGEIADGYVWGRGAIDDKSAALAQMEAIEMLLGEGFQSRRTIYLAYGHDEEVGGVDGAARISEMLARLGVAPGLVLDEGGAIVTGSIPGVDTPVALIGVAEKGYLSLALTADSPGGHSSMPPQNSAVGIVAHAISRLEDEQMPTRLTPPVRSMFEHVGPHMSFLNRLVFANLWLSRPLLEHVLTREPATNAMVRTTTAATMFSGSYKQNVLPTRAVGVVNFRILPGDTRASVMEHVARTVDDPRINVGTLSFSSEPSPASPVGEGAYNLLDATIRQTIGDNGLEVAPYLVVGATDARYYARLTPRVYRFQPQRMAPADLARVHGTNERIGVENYAEMIRFYYQLLRNVNDIKN